MANWEQMSLYDRFVTYRQKEMEKDRAEFDEMRSSVVEYLRPDLTGDTKTEQGKQKGASIVESTGQFHAKTMAKWFVGNLVGPTLDWLRYKMAERRYKGDDRMNAFLQRVAEFMLEDVYAYPKSNFYLVNNSFVLDGITVGSPVMIIESDVSTGSKTCTLPHFTENYLKRDWFGNDIAYHRKWSVDNMSAWQAFGDSLPQPVKNELENGIYDTKHEYLMCVCRAGDMIFDYKDTRPENRIPRLWPWMQLWFSLDSTTIDEKKPLNYLLDDDILKPQAAGGYYHKPYHSWHYARLPGETYSRTPGWESLADVRGLNAAWRSVHQLAHAAAQPSTIALESLKGKLRMGAEGVTWVTENQYDRPPVHVQNRANYSWAMDFIDRRSATVGRHFFSDMARMIENYSREHKQPPTAFQISQMISETMVLIGPAITSYAGPYLQGIDEQFIELEMRSGRFFQETNPPDEAFEGSGQILPVFRGPLLQQLRYAMLSKRIQQPLTMAAPIFEIWPESRHKVKAAELVETLLESGDFPQGAITSQEEYQEIVQAIQEENAQMAYLEKMKLAGEAAKNMQGETGENSPLQKLSGDAA